MLKDLVNEKIGVITTVLEDKFIAFAQLEDGDSVFIGSNLTSGLEVADTVSLIVVPNPRFSHSTQWKAIKVDLIEDPEPEPEAPRMPTQDELQGMIMDLLEADPDTFFSSHYIQKSLGLGIGHGDVRIVADKLHSAQRICRAKVQGPSYQKRTEFYVYSKNIEAFLFEDEEVEFDG